MDSTRVLGELSSRAGVMGIIKKAAFLLRIVQELKKTVETAGEEAADHESTTRLWSC